MEAIFSSETSADFQQTTQRFIPEDSTLNNISVNTITTTHSNIRVEPTPKTYYNHILNTPLTMDNVQHNICIINQHRHKLLETKSFLEPHFQIWFWQTYETFTGWMHHIGGVEFMAFKT
jgi:hypothetical protein